MKVEQMINNNGNGAMNQFVIRDGQRIFFQSYRSTIAMVDYENNVVLIYPDYDYSRTTGKHRNIFFADYAHLAGLASLEELRKAIKAGTYNGYTVKMEEE